MRRDIDQVGLRVLRAFDALMAERSVTRAAEALGLTQQGMSGQLSRLRAFFDDPLFLRAQNTMIPTPLAETLWPRVRRALAEIDALAAPEQFDPAVLDQTIGIAASDYATALLVPQLLARLRQDAPRLRVGVRQARSASLLDEMQSGTIHLALTVPQFTPQGMKSLRLLSDEYVGVTRRGHPIAGTPVDLETFCRWPHLLVSPDKGDFEGAVDAALAGVGARREVALVVPGFSVVASLLDATDLITVLPWRLLAHITRPLAVFPLPVELPGFDLCVTWSNRKEADPLTEWLRGLCHEVARDGDREEQGGGDTRQSSGPMPIGTIPP